MFKSILAAIHEPIYRRRIAVLASLIVPQLRAGDSVLDIGCGSGLLGAEVLAHAACPPGVTYQGIEKYKRGGEPIEVFEQRGDELPFADGAFDVVILADVLHHEEHDERLLDEAARVCRRFIIIKDHKPEGFLAYFRICFLDWAANHPHGVRCLYRYYTRAHWRQIFAERGLAVVTDYELLNLYPAVYNGVFGRRLQYLAVLEVRAARGRAGESLESQRGGSPTVARKS